MQADTLLFQIRRMPEQEHSDEDEIQMSNLDYLDPQEEEELNGAAGPEEKMKRRKTIR